MVDTTLTLRQRPENVATLDISIRTARVIMQRGLAKQIYLCVPSCFKQPFIYLRVETKGVYGPTGTPMAIQVDVRTMVADTDGLCPDPDPTIKKKLDPDPTFEREKNRTRILPNFYNFLHST